MAANGASIPGTSLPELPPLDVDTALAPSGAASNNPARSTDLGVPFTPLGGAVTPGALPLLVRMPDGERRQIELPPTATVRDLRNALHDDSNVDLNFNGQLMRDDNMLSTYNIPDAYGHAGGLLKMITDSGELDPSQKVEALNSACNIVATISRGETDMERLISAALEDSNANANADDPPPPQPSLREVRRGKRSFPSLNLSNLPPPTLNSDRAGSSLAPPTPSQLISKLSAQRPDIYPPNTASRMLALDASATNAAGAGASTAPAGKVEASAIPDPVPGVSSSALFNPGSPPPQPAAGNGEFKRVPTNTWFSEFARHIAPFPDGGPAPPPVDQPNQDDSIGDSEDDLPAKPSGAPANATESLAGANPKPRPPANSEPQVTEQTKPATLLAPTSQPNASAASAPLPGAVASRPLLSTTAGTAAPLASRAGSAAAASGTSAAASSAAGALSTAAAAMAKPSAPQPKKRGRKRKNPELSEEERKALRQAQNRASAKQSRMRRKVMAAEYEKRVTTLEGENETLRDTVAALSDRLQFLQNLLTVSVQKRPPGTGGHI